MAYSLIYGPIIVIICGRYKLFIKVEIYVIFCQELSLYWSDAHFEAFFSKRKVRTDHLFIINKGLYFFKFYLMVLSLLFLAI